ncbi:hypothetical protein [Streptacidiphilus sp. MAP5-52]|uniref:hypothetical protein n=1 Tax=Streptacidiphilus sp. MAP5-52 TaxID=3156267 RepID=UPI0035186839
MATAACGTTTTTTAASAPTSRSTAPTEDPLASLSGPTIVAKAYTDLGTAASVHIVSNTGDGGQGSNVNLQIVLGKGCSGTVNWPGTGSIQLVVIGTQMWMKPDAAYWKTEGNAVPASVHGKYLLGSTANSRLAPVAGYCTMTKTMAAGKSDLSGMTKGTPTTVNGQKALNISDAKSTWSLIVSDTATPEILEVLQTVGAESGSSELDHYNVPVILTPPPSSQVVDGTAYGM